MSEKRVRSQNYCTEDTLRLVEIVIGFKNIVENKKTDAVTSSEKNKAWEKMCEIYNTQTTSHRTGEQLRKKYDSLKKETRKYYAQQRQQRLMTGGGPYVEPKFHIIYSKILEIIKLSAEGHHSQFDSDATFQEIPENTESLEFEVIPYSLTDSSEIQYTGSDSESCGASVPLTTPIHSTDTTVPKTTMQILKSCVHPALDASSDNAAAINTSCNTDLRLLTDDANGVNLAISPGEGTSSSQISVNRSSRGSRKPVIRRQRLPLSASAKKMLPWVNAKTELSELQSTLLQKQHDEAQRREEELFLIKKELLQMEKRSLELEIRIKEETLKKLISK